MTLAQIFEVSGAILVSIGGAAAIIFGLSSFLAKVWANRILESDRDKYRQEIERLKHDNALQKSSYERYMDLIVDYHDFIYRHYRVAQNAASFDVLNFENKPKVNTKRNFVEHIDGFRDELNQMEGRLRIILPKQILDLHEDHLNIANEFKDRVKAFLKNPVQERREAIETQFDLLDASQKELETALRDLLRTENLLK
jgi:hypothetical protein